jgi:hypothetical protein
VTQAIGLLDRKYFSIGLEICGFGREFLYHLLFRFYHGRVWLEGYPVTNGLNEGGLATKGLAGHLEASGERRWVTEGTLPLVTYSIDTS